MNTACMKSCNFCKDKGCTDEFPKCLTWQRDGYCQRIADTMSLYCRESCGTCGFRSPRNQEIQSSNRRSYTDLESRDFFCGEGNLRNENEKNDLRTGRNKRQTQTEEDEDGIK